MQISKSAKREKVCHLCIGIYIWNYYGLIIEKVSTGMVDEKVTVISSFLTLLIFLLMKLGTHQLQLVISMKVTVIFSNKTKARFIIK